MNTTFAAAGFGVGTGRGDLQLVTFYFCGHQYALDVDDVYGIYHGLPLIPLPDLSVNIDGEIQVSDQRIPVVNLRRFADLPEAATTNFSSWVVAVNQPGGPVGIAVDRVAEVVRLEPRSLAGVDGSLKAPIGSYIQATAGYHGRTLLLPDVSRLIQDAMN
ncbi:chemotaxis protein CheW [candidate division KSB1 bacterium]|nr:chemotaxis protein CheW [candidate division KSB1 bacterium]